MKRMIIVLPLSFLLVTGGSFYVLASTGKHVNSWYLKQFSETTADLDKDISFIDTLSGDMGKFISSANNEIREFTSLSKQQAESIQSHSQSHISIVSKTSKELSQTTAEQYKDYKQKRMEEEAAIATQNVHSILDEVLKEQ
ncbi:hypothetical protein J9317_18685 [Metabacillus sp. KIGAM252]|uniref:DUF4363 family protein n=1 Tax=Metabacillus flavus TaxID=2823519 RepID=A0ABS5LK84_9BACI|nr:hypothetical protein [Metabacillus flavus]MBS2970774.1 hypothetical protein [Metabacillus flavus]